MVNRYAPIGRLDDLPRVRLLSFATPLEEMANLGAAVGGPALYVKRDDLTGLAFGGNKVRQLEFYLGEAVEQGADTILVTGAVQSNFVRLAAAAARKYGMECHIQLEERVPKNDPLYKSSGNVLLDRILGATIHSYPHGEDEEGADARLREIAGDVERRGGRPYIIPLAPGHAPLGALGYVDAARELLVQSEELGLQFDEIVLASGSGHTHAGLLFGLRALGSEIPVTGVCVRRLADQQIPRLVTRCREIADLLDMDNVVSDQDICVDDGHLAPGYGHMSEAVRNALRLAATSEGLITDPVYTAKAMAGLLDRARASDGDGKLLFIHTGGTPALFAYEKVVV
jgi:D-cysteine desulfhydrase family pyridoxal phosphate-dependent enzyme